MDKRQITFLDTLNKSLGVLTLALQQSGVRKHEYDDWMQEMEFEEKVNEIQESSLDFVENQLMKLIREGDMTAITFYLKTKGKHRGY